MRVSVKRAGVERLSSERKRAYRSKGPRCRYFDAVVKDLSSFFAVFNSLIKDKGTYWFRGHSNYEYKLSPSALRYRKKGEREQAVGLLSDFKRYSELKLRRVPPIADDLQWLQVGQHYGLPTRLLDWTQNAGVALYLACRRTKTDGAVIIVNPVELNLALGPKYGKVLDPNEDAKVIEKYLKNSGGAVSASKSIVAVNPVWNSDRIVMQRGAFTLHAPGGSELTQKHASSLIYVPILQKYKGELLRQLDHIGVNEMGIFPEVEHLCEYLKYRAGLKG